jgi:hypothetical protein
MGLGHREDALGARLRLNDENLRDGKEGVSSDGPEESTPSAPSVLLSGILWTSTRRGRSNYRSHVAKMRSLHWGSCVSEHKRQDEHDTSVDGKTLDLRWIFWYGPRDHERAPPQLANSALSFGGHRLTRMPDSYTTEDESEVSAPLGEPQMAPGFMHRSSAAQSGGLSPR